MNTLTRTRSPLRPGVPSGTKTSTKGVPAPNRTAWTHLPVGYVDGQVDVPERAGADLPDQLVLSPDDELGLRAAAGRHDIQHLTTPN